MVVPKAAPVPTPLKYCSLHQFLLKKLLAISFAYADPNIPIATPATPAAPAISNFLLNFKVLIGLLLAKPLAYQTFLVAFVFFLQNASETCLQPKPPEKLSTGAENCLATCG
jgi:hypothetical protein